MAWGITHPEGAAHRAVLAGRLQPKDGETPSTGESEPLPARGAEPLSKPPTSIWAPKGARHYGALRRLHEGSTPARAETTKRRRSEVGSVSADQPARIEPDP